MENLIHNNTDERIVIEPGETLKLQHVVWSFGDYETRRDLKVRIMTTETWE